jgi:predicted O-methyltransferase YrrM
MLDKLAQFTTRMAKIASHNPRDVQHVLGMANYAAGLIEKPEADVRFAPLVDVLDIYPQSGRWGMQTFPGVGASVSPMECMALAALIHRAQAKRVFEFGTYKGVSTTQLALNVGEDGMVFTLDLPEDHPAYSLPIPKESEREIANETGKGILIPADLRSRVTFLRHDSATFDESPYHGSMDFVFVDGAHSYEYVKSDSLKGWKMLREGGILAWHDFVPSHPDVVRFVRECGWYPQHVTDTTLAFAVKS